MSVAARPVLSEASATEYARLRSSVALIEFPERGVLHLAGPDGRAFLQGLVTSDVGRLADGRGRSAAEIAGAILAAIGIGDERNMAEKSGGNSVHEAKPDCGVTQPG